MYKCRSRQTQNSANRKLLRIISVRKIMLPKKILWGQKGDNRFRSPCSLKKSKTIEQMLRCGFHYSNWLSLWGAVPLMRYFIKTYCYLKGNFKSASSPYRFQCHNICSDVQCRESDISGKLFLGRRQSHHLASFALIDVGSSMGI